MDAIRLARAATGRDHVVKMEGSYHGHHDRSWSRSASTSPPTTARTRRRARSPYGAGIPRAIVEMTVVVAVQRRRRAGRAPLGVRGQGRVRDHGSRDDEHRGRAPRAGLPRARARDHAQAQRAPDLRRGQDGRHGLARRRDPIRREPDIVTLAKAMGGGLPTAAIGGTDEVMQFIENGASTRSARSTATRSAWRPPRPTCRGHDAGRLQASRLPEHRADPAQRRRHRALRPARLHGRRRREGCVTFASEKVRTTASGRRRPTATSPTSRGSTT